jgi:hypothetical protein
MIRQGSHTRKPMPSIPQNSCDEFKHPGPKLKERKRKKTLIEKNYTANTFFSPPINITQSHS